MLRDDKTFEVFGYHIDSLSIKSSKEICLECDYCHSIFNRKKKNRTKSNLILDKDACDKCGVQKREEVCMIQHGVKNPAQLSSVRQKIKDSKNHIDYDAVSLKYKKTMKEKYGVDNAMHSKILSDKQKDTLKSNYGVTNPTQSNEIKEKVKQSMLEKYGETSFLKTDECKKKFIDKYGVTNPSYLPDHIEKRKETCLKKYGEEHYLKVKENGKIHGQFVLQSKINNGLIKLYDGKPISEYRDLSGYSDSHFRTLIHQHGFDIARSMTPHVSSLEKVIDIFLKENNIEYTKGTISGYRPDFIIENKKVIIETDGLYWHSDAVCEDNSYHIKKREAYNAAGYRALFFREDEIRDKLPTVKSVILNSLGMSKKIYARDCELIWGHQETMVAGTHLMGAGAGTIFSLLNGGETVASFQVKRINGNDWELSRFCTANGISVIGGFSRLLTAFEREMKPDSLKTFIDMRYGSGHYLTKFGFTEETCYASFRWTDLKNTFPRTRFRSNSGYDKGMYKIWDCGQKKFVKVYKVVDTL